MTSTLVATAVLPGSEESRIIDEELQLLADIQKELAEDASDPSEDKAYDEELLALRDQISEARVEDQAPLIAEMYRMQALGRANGRGRDLRVDPNCPYFGHLMLTEGPKTKHVLVGNRGFVKNGSPLAIVDWRNAPVSRIYYCYDEGDEYEEQFGGREVVGLVTARRTLSISEGRLRRISWSSGTVVQNGKGEWLSLPRQNQPTLAGGAGVASRPPPASSQPRYRKPKKGQLGVVGDESLREDKHLKEITALIDPEQFRLITQPESGTIILQGGAGSGKTTVALHRAAYLHFQNPQVFSPKKMAIVVKSEPLTEYISRVLPSLDVVGTEVVTLENWMRKTRLKVLPHLKQKTTHDTPPVVARLKKHPVILQALETFIEREADRVLKAALESVRPECHAVLKDKWASMARRALLLRIQQMGEWLKGQGSHRAGLSPNETQAMLGALRRHYKSVQDIHGAWADALTDRALIQDAAKAKGQTLSDGDIEELVRWVSVQSEEPIPEDDEEDEPDRASHADEGPQDHFDEHDDALLLKLTQLTYGGLPIRNSGRSVLYEHVVVDEAQDLSPTDVAVLRGALTRRQSMTLAGDTAQKLIFDNGFEDWETMLRDVGVEGMTIDQLKVSYRSTQEIVDFSRHVLGPLADPEAPIVPRQGAPVDLFDFGSTGEAVAFLGAQLRSLVMRERRANIAVVARYAAQADTYYRGLQRSEVPALRRVYGKNFSFQPGVDVVDVAQIKGLEYDYVILVEVNESSYPERKEARHLLHIGATRAVHQLWVTSVGQASALLPKTDA